MAKLPDIQYRRNVPQFRSGKQAELGNKLRGIGAIVSTARGAADTVNQAFETEAKLDAQRLKNEAVRTYQTRLTDMAQEYHTDRTKLPEEFAREARTMREEVFTEISSTGGRVGKYLAPDLDNLRTKYEPFEQQQAIKLAESRSLMSLNDIQNDAIDSVASNPTTIDLQYANYAESVDATTLPASVKMEMKETFANQTTATAINTYLNEGDIAGLSSVMEMDSFKRMSLEAQNNTRNMVKSLSVELYNDQTLAMRNGVVSGDSVQVAYDQAEASISAMPGYTDYEKEKLTQNAKFMYSDDHFTGLLARDQYQIALGELQSGEFDTLLSPGKKAAYLSRAKNGLERKSTISAVMANQKIADGVAIADATGNTDQLDVALAEGTALMPNLSDSGQQSMQLRIDAATIQGEAVKQAETFHGQTQTELAETLRDLYSGQAADDIIGQDNGTARLNSLAWTQAKAAQIASERAENPAGYVINQNGVLADKYSTLAADAATMDLNDFSTQQGLNARWASLKVEMDEAQADLGITVDTRKSVPQGYAPFSLPSGVLTSASSTRQEKIGALNSMVAVFGPDTSEVLMASGAPQAAVAAAGMAEVGQTAQAVVHMEGVNKLEVFKSEGGSIPTFKRAMMVQGSSAGYDVPFEMWGGQRDELNEMIFTQAVGYMDGAFLDAKKPVPDLDAWKKAHVDVLGHKANVNRGEFGQYTYSYTQDDGTEATASTMTKQIETLRKQGVPGVTLYDGFSNPISWQDAVERGWLVPTSGSHYRIDMKPLGGGEGWLTDEPGSTKAYEFDMKLIPMAAFERRDDLVPSIEAL